MAKKKQPKAPVNEYPKIIETFKPIGDWELMRMAKDSPSAINGSVSFRKYRVTVEEIQEPTEVLSARLQVLWDNCDNYHQWDPLKAAASEIGYTLLGSVGNKVNRNR